MAAGRVLERDHEAGARAEDAHAGRRLVAPRDALQLVARPHAEDGAHLRLKRLIVLVSMKGHDKDDPESPR